MRERITPDNTFFDEATCEQLGIEYNEDPFEEDFISEEETDRIIAKEYELIDKFLNRHESSWYESNDEEEKPAFIKFYQEEKPAYRVHNKIEYIVIEPAYGLWVDMESIYMRYNSDELSMGCISGSRLRFINRLIEYAKKHNWHIDYKNKKVKKARIEGYVDEKYIDKVYIQRKLK